MKTNYKKYENRKEIITDNKIINYLNRVMIILILFNFSIMKFKIFSTIELRIFFDKNRKITNAIYLILFIYSFGYISFISFQYFIKKIEKRNKIK